AAILKLLQITLVNFSALTLKIRTEISANVRTFVPIQSEPIQAVINCGGGFLGVALGISVLDSQHKFATVMANKEPIEQRCARAANVQKAGRRRSKTNTNFGAHCFLLR